MLDKLESSPDNPSKSDLLENIEGKVLDLQSQLRTVREERESGIAPPQVTPLSFGGRGGRGRGRGRSQLQSGGYYPHYAGRGEPTGRGRGYSQDDDGEGGRGRGRGRFGGRGAAAGPGRGRGQAGFTTIDNRTRSLVVILPPEGFDSSAKEHFER